MKKKIAICLIVQIICWSIMTLSDYVEETYNDSYNLVVVFAVPLICVILYIIFRKWIYDNQIVRLKDVAIICAAWMICGLILGFLIGALVLNEMWIVSQATGGWEHFLNGIEYMMFCYYACRNTICGCGIDRDGYRNSEIGWGKERVRRMCRKRTCL